MNFFSGILGCARGVIAGFKNGGGIEKALIETETMLNILIQPIRNKYNGKVPNLIYTDSFLIGFLFKFSALYLMFFGLKEKFLLTKAVFSIVPKSIDMPTENFINRINSISADSGDLKQFEAGGLLAEKTYELFLTKDKYVLVDILDHITTYYEILPKARG